MENFQNLFGDQRLCFLRKYCTCKTNNEFEEKQFYLFILIYANLHEKLTVNF